VGRDGAESGSALPGYPRTDPELHRRRGCGKPTRHHARVKAAHAVKANPDSPQLPVRARALAEGKLLYMAVPKLRDLAPFTLIDPTKAGPTPCKAASIRGATRVGRAVAISAIDRIDLVVCGSVAVNRKGARVGKGGGFSDLEFALLTEAGLVGETTTIATTVHPLQILDQELPETSHDFRVDLIVTPGEVIRPRRRSRRRPVGIIWSDLDEDKIRHIPVLEARRLAELPDPGDEQRSGPL
jgi:5-formyltetrahydrofolate cyclo-ligase